MSVLIAFMVWWLVSGAGDSSGIKLSNGHLLRIADGTRLCVQETDRWGRVYWQFQLEDVDVSTLPAIGDKAAYLIHDSQFGVFGITDKGKVAWRKSGVDQIPFFRPVSVVEGNRCFVTSFDYDSRQMTLMCLSLNGETMWTFKRDSGYASGIVQNKAGEVFVLTQEDNFKCGIPEKGTLYALDKLGNLKWQFERTPTNLVIEPLLRVEENRLVYLASGGNGLREDLYLAFDGSLIGSKKYGR